MEERVEAVREYHSGLHISISREERERIKNETVKTKFNKSLLNVHAMEMSALGNNGFTYNFISPNPTRMEYEFLISRLKSELSKIG